MPVDKYRDKEYGVRKMNERIFVIAGNFNQFRLFRRTLINTMIEQGNDVRVTDIIYVGEHNMYGCDDMWGYKVGTWQERKDIDNICLMLMSRRSSIDNFIEVEL